LVEEEDEAEEEEEEEEEDDSTCFFSSSRCKVGVSKVVFVLFDPVVKELLTFLSSTFSSC